MSPWSCPSQRYSRRNGQNGGIPGRTIVPGTRLSAMDLRRCPPETNRLLGIYGGSRATDRDLGCLRSGVTAFAMATKVARHGPLEQLVKIIISIIVQLLNLKTYMVLDSGTIP